MKAVIMYNHLWLIIIAICCWLGGCSPKGDEGGEHTVKDMPVATLEGFHLLETVHGKPQWELSGKNADIQCESEALRQSGSLRQRGSLQKVINLRGITCTFFHPQTEKAVFKIKANNGSLETNSRMIELVGEVMAEDIIDRDSVTARVATPSSRNVFCSSRLIWDAARLVLISPEEITIQMNGAVFKAETMIINPATEVVEARGVRISVAKK